MSDLSLFFHKWQASLRPQSLLRFAIGDGGLKLAGGRLEKADLIYIGKSNSRRGFADSYSKVISVNIGTTVFLIIGAGTRLNLSWASFFASDSHKNCSLNSMLDEKS